MSLLDTRKISMAMGILPSSAEFKIVERAIEISRQQALLKKANYICFPLLVQNIRYNAFGSGKVNFDFPSGRATGFDSAGAVVNYVLAGSMEKVRSLMVFVSDTDAVLYLDGKEICGDHNLWHLFEDIDIERLDILLPSGKIPNNFGVAFFASDKPNHSYKSNLFVSHDVQTSTIVLATASIQTSLLRHIAGYDTAVISTNNSSAVSLNLYVDYSADGVTYYPVSGYNPKVLATTVIDELDILVKYHFLRARVSRVTSDAAFSQVIQVAR